MNSPEFMVGMTVGINVSLSHSYFLPDCTVTLKCDGFDGSIYISISDALEHRTKEDMSRVL